MGFLSCYTKELLGNKIGRCDIDIEQGIQENGGISEPWCETRISTVRRLRNPSLRSIIHLLRRLCLGLHLTFPGAVTMVWMKSANDAYSIVLRTA